MLTAERWAHLRAACSEAVAPGSPFEVDVDAVFRRTRAGWYICVATFWAALLSLAIAVFLWFAMSDGQVPVLLSIPAPGLLMFGVGIAGAVVLSLVPSLHLSLKRLGALAGADVYAVGVTPFTGAFVMISDDCLVAFDRRGSMLNQWSRSYIDAIAVKQFGNAVSVVLFSHDQCFELSISTRVGGPAAPVWSSGGGVGQTRLRTAIEESLRRGSYPFTTV